MREHGSLERTFERTFSIFPSQSRWYRSCCQGRCSLLTSTMRSICDQSDLSAMASEQLLDERRATSFGKLSLQRSEEPRTEWIDGSIANVLTTDDYDAQRTGDQPAERRTWEISKRSSRDFEDCYSFLPQLHETMPVRVLDLEGRS